VQDLLKQDTDVDSRQIWHCGFREDIMKMNCGKRKDWDSHLWKLWVFYLIFSEEKALPYHTLSNFYPISTVYYDENRHSSYNVIWVHVDWRHCAIKIQLKKFCFYLRSVYVYYYSS
jgi:hypothetical protein